MSSRGISSQACMRSVLLTGKPGIGKTTVVKKVCEVLAQRNINVRGFYTEEIRQQNCRIGFDVVTLGGCRGPLARASSETSMRGPRVGKYLVNLQSFEDLVIPIMSATPSYDSVLIVDEIGRMEMLSKKFCKQVESIFMKPQTILATVPIAPNVFVKNIQSQPSSQLIEVNYLNRNTLVESIVEVLNRSLANN